MIGRRDLLIGIGATVGSGGLAYRMLNSPRVNALEYQLGNAAPSLDHSSDLSCTRGALTAAQQEGPFYTPETPLRRDIRNAFPRMAPFIVTGHIVDSSCQPIAGAVVDFWQTADDGAYDNQSYDYRGHQFTDAEGRFELITVRPSAYTALGFWRGPHIHVKVQGPGTPLLTTQLYMPDEHEFNSRDGGYDPALAVRLAGRSGEAELAKFDFVLDRA